ncbi:enoyl-CoA hydratase [Paraburkholderia phenoliruptrix]|uniref:enoyl-CoA hydratase n=1 Tax=Paraburkholderia phenoliruptrix TaxID=252970 RepID=UPI002869C4BF|nr:enoyl-CoA hydratase [Paraburkholderia phenoliruptrix]WMY12375.1 enoyl-CoA hydratase [Paraburkholderia phenoliruptrix]
MIELDYAHGGAVAQLTLNRPPANAFTPEGLLHLQQTVARLNGEARVRAIVITGEGPKFFSAGADLNTFADGNREVARVAAARFGAAFEALQNARPVVIAAINGYAMGGGLECALACDIRIAEQHAVMALPETAVGLLPCGCGTQTLPWLVGEGWAKRMILTGERVDAATALRIRLVEEVVDKGAAREAALAMAARVATLSPQAVGFSKTLIHQARHGVPRSAALALERERFVDLFDGADQREGVNAFLEKRAPRWEVMQDGEPANAQNTTSAPRAEHEEAER